MFLQAGASLRMFRPYTKSFFMTTSATLSYAYSFRQPFNRRCFAPVYGNMLSSSDYSALLYLSFVFNRCTKGWNRACTILGAAELPTAIIASITLVHEVVTFMQWIGIIFILVGIFTPQLLTARKERKQNRVHSA